MIIEDACLRNIKYTDSLFHLIFLECMSLPKQLEDDLLSETVLLSGGSGLICAIVLLFICDEYRKEVMS